MGQGASLPDGGKGTIAGKDSSEVRNGSVVGPAGSLEFCDVGEEMAVGAGEGFEDASAERSDAGGGMEDLLGRGAITFESGREPGGEGCEIGGRGVVAKDRAERGDYIGGKVFADFFLHGPTVSPEAIVHSARTQRDPNFASAGFRYSEQDIADLADQNSYRVGRQWVMPDLNRRFVILEKIE